MDNIKVQEPGAKYCHYTSEPDKGYDVTYFNGLLSEKLVIKTEKGRTRWAWVKLPGHERNEALDCRNYATAAFRVLDPDLDAIENRLKNFSGKVIQDKPKTTIKKAPRKNRISNNDW